MFRTSVLVFVVALLWLPAEAVFCQEQTVESQGVAAVVHGNADISRDKAIDDALRNAVEQATGSYIENQTLVENYQLLSDKIYSRSRGYVESYEVISERVNEGLFGVTIRAKVKSGELENDLQALNILMGQVRKPRVMVLFEESSDRGGNCGRMAEGFFSKVLLERGFKLVDADTVRRNLGHDKVMGLLAGDETVATAIGSKYGAEILLVGNVQTVSQPITIGEFKINSNQAVISVRLIRADTGEVQLSETAQAAKPHINELTGGQLAVREASESLATVLVKGIVQIFQEQVYNVTSVTLIMHGLQDYNQLQEVVRLISTNVRGIRDTFQRNYAIGTAELEVELTGNTQSLASDLTARSFGRYEFAVNQITHNRLQVTVTTIDN
ncbi:MAG: flagellar assembly protein T N-terminal domain-containing protein [Deltaproteobacteria bacterium]|nr:MAG: flagellar assembly protein T N-terminal domain-containing protein [Deltaproteobacteria bacterium]